MNVTYKLDKQEHQRTATRSVAEVSLWYSFGTRIVFLWTSVGAIKKMAGYSSSACCVSKLRSSPEANMKQLGVWLQYASGVAEMLMDEPSGRAERLYPSTGALDWDKQYSRTSISY